MLKQFVSLELKKRFPRMNIEFGDIDTDIIATIPPVHASWKPIVIRDDGHEVTVFYGSFTHDHHKYYGEDAPIETKAQAIANVVVDELAMIFADQIKFYLSGRVGPVGATEELSRVKSDSPAKLWSGKDIP